MFQTRFRRLAVCVVFLAAWWFSGAAASLIDGFRALNPSEMRTLVAGQTMFCPGGTAGCPGKTVPWGYGVAIPCSSASNGNACTSSGIKYCTVDTTQLYKVCGAGGMTCTPNNSGTTPCGLQKTCPCIWDPVNLTCTTPTPPCGPPTSTPCDYSNCTT